VSSKAEQPYKLGQRVAGWVEKILSFGVFVRLGDGTRAYIRRREMSWAGDVEPSQLVSHGQEIAAEVIDLGGHGLSMEISYKATLPDPWQEFTRQFQERDVVTATAKRLVSSGVFVQIVPGVDGFIPLGELATWEVERPEQLLWIGDHVEAVITRIDARRHKVALSIREHLEHLSQVDNLIQQLRHEAEPQITAEGLPPEAGTIPDEEGWIEEPLPPDDVERIGSILVVEDDNPVRLSLVDWLRRQGCPVEGAKTAREALQHCKTREYGLVIADLNLPGADGLSFLRRLRDAASTVPVAVMSSPELIDEHLQAFSALHVATAFAKPLDLEEIWRFLLRLASGDELVLSSVSSEQALSVEGQPFQRLARAMRSSHPLAERFRQGLEDLVRQTRAEEGIVFHLDPVSKKVSMVTRAGQLVLSEEKNYGLVDSPVKDVIVEGRAVREGRVSQERTARFRKLLEFLAFESCLGVPIQAGGRTEHAVFLFHREPDMFSRYRVRDAQAVAALFAVALERQALDERVQHMSGVLLSGQLAAGFGHEVFNKLSALDLQFRNLRSDFARMSQQDVQLSEQSKVHIEEALGQAVETALDLKRAVREFRGLMEAREEQTVDANQIVHRAVNQTRPLARRSKIQIHLELASDLPPATGSGVRLQQVLLNVMLNAVQHMAHKPDNRRVLEVTTVYETADDACPVQVRISDTGPGIHRQLWEEIFGLGFTTRPDGTGLGLFIARSLMESMRGRIIVQESLIPLGTTFAVSLPTAQDAEFEE